MIRRASDRAGAEPVGVMVWDLPTRLAHWGMVVLFALAWLSAEQGWFAWHRAAGLGMLVLVGFRICWGLWGGGAARFANFVRGPRAVWAYLGGLRRTRGAVSSGHNPAGGWSVMTMLLLLLLQSGLGLFALDEYGTAGGPLARHVSFEAARRVTALHMTVFDLLWIAVVLHVSAVAAYLLFRRENLVAPMITGRRRHAVGPGPYVAPLRRAAAIFAALTAVVLALATYG